MNLIHRTILATLLGMYIIPAVAQEAEGVTGKTITIGMSNALSGPAAALGTELREGALLYLNDVNAAGGIHGRTIKLISLDDGYEPTRTISNTRRLIEQEKVFALFGYVGTPTSKVAVPIASHAGVPFIAPFSGADLLRNPVSRYVFNIRAGYDDETEALVHHLVDRLNVGKIGMFIQDDAYGSAGRAGIEKALQARSMKEVAVAKYTRNTSDVSAAVNSLKASGAEAIIMVGAYRPCAAFIKEARNIGFNPIFMNISFVGTSALVEAMGADGEGVYISQVMPPPEDTQLSIVARYNDAISKQRQAKPGYGSLEGYIDAVVLVEILKRLGPNPTREGFVKTAETIKNLDLGGLGLSFSSNDHQGFDTVYLTQVKNGKPVTIPQ